MTTPTEKTPLTDPDNVMWVVESPASADGEGEVEAEVLAAAFPKHPVQELQSGMPGDLKDYWLHGEGALKVRWGTEGSFRRCVKELNEYFPDNTEGLCANLYHEATGHWPGEDRKK